ncbi:MAG: hypothetical protein Q9225_002830 [Loekoesia sp. 1 TL-2023]
MARCNYNVCSRKHPDRGPDIRALAKSILEEAEQSPERNRDKSKPNAPENHGQSSALSGSVRPSTRSEDGPIQPDKSGVWLEQHPPQHVRKKIEQAKEGHSKAPEAPVAGDNKRREAERKIRASGSLNPENHRSRDDSREPAGQTPLFDTGLYRWGLGPVSNTEIYEYYRGLNREIGNNNASKTESNVSLLREVLQDDAQARQEDNVEIGQWVQKREIARGGFARVYLWEKHSPGGGPRLRMAVKDSEASKFWQDYHSEGTLIRQLNEAGCENVITILDWLYKPASPLHDAFIRTCYEYADHGDLEDTLRFYRKHQLVVPESFVWHVFGSTANALCYCRHGTNKSNITRPGWDTMIHGDVKPANILLAQPNESVTSLYPAIKLGDFGVAYSVQESNVKLRAWKSTFRYGTNRFMAPEVEAVNPKTNGNFSPVAASNIHGSHSDIWSLGAVIEGLMATRFNALKDHPKFDSPFVEEYYSSRLQNLTAACKTYSIHSRPAIYEVYVPRNSPDDQPFHCQVLFSKADRERFLNDRAFRKAYTKVNRAPLLEGKTAEHPTENVPKPALPFSKPQRLTTPSTEPLHNKVQAVWNAGGFKNSDTSLADVDTTAPSTQSSAFIIPDFGLRNPPEPPHQSTPPPFAAPAQISPHSPTPTILASPPPFAASPLTLPALQASAISPHSPSPTILAPPPPVPTQSKPNQQGQNAEQGPKRKLSRFVEDLPEVTRVSEGRGNGLGAKRALRRTGALRRSKRGNPERKVRFDVDVEVDAGKE